jgi:hypothetical protein
MTSKKRPYVLLVAIGLGLIPGAALAGGNAFVVEPAAPVHRFLDAKNLGLQSINILIMAADIASTRRALQTPGAREANPLAGSQGALLALKIAGVGASLGIAYMMHRSGHHTIERVIPAILGGPSAIAAIHNVAIHR